MCGTMITKLKFRKWHSINPFQNSAKIRKEAEKLVKDIDALKAEVKKGGKAGGAAITNLLERGKALSEREAERISTGRQKLRAESTVKKNLIKAKPHIAYFMKKNSGR